MLDMRLMTKHPHSDIQRLMHEIDNYQTIKDHITSPVEALKKQTNNSLLVMVELLSGKLHCS